MQWTLYTLLLLLAGSARAAPGGPRIVGGVPIEENSNQSNAFLYHVQVGLFNKTSQQAASLFGGALITERFEIDVVSTWKSVYIMNLNTITPSFNLLPSMHSDNVFSKKTQTNFLPLFMPYEIADSIHYNTKKQLTY